MTPQERQLIAQLFDRLGALESAPRDPDAERAIAEGLARAPHATYPLVQTVLVQDEALKRANARIADLEGQLQATGAEPPRQGGFLDNMREALLGRDDRRGSVPTVRPGAASAGPPPVWNSGAPGPSAYYGQPGYAQPAMGQPIGSGGSFLGTAAASAAGVIGGAMLLNGIRSMFGHSYGPGPGAYDAGIAPDPASSPWTDASNSDLARQAGIDNIGGGSDRAGFFGGGNDDVQPEDTGYADSDDNSDLADSDFGGDDNSDLA
ncbi:MAG TPA: DUF2076 domain-containing protein [Xanthobacteraceae bacterium]|nr:DUF2076 domain-containing protein [Xanthobacteraceae bacterium]